MWQFINKQMKGCQNVQYTQFDGLVQDCSISIANALEMLQSCAEPLVGVYC